MLAMYMGRLTPGGVGGASNPDGQAAVAVSPAELDLIIAIRQAFNNPVRLDSTNAVDLPLIRRLLERQNQRGESDQAGVLGKDAAVESIRPGNYPTTGCQVPFETNSAVLSDAARQRIVETAQQVRGLELMVDVRGHASAAETVDDKSKGLDLAYQRAMAVARVLVDNGLQWRQLRLTACGDNDRINPLVYDAVGHYANQRVEIVVSEDVVPTR
jgi:outer membrane protein OmpA-like peptidoglycan-associated protein